jgi:PhnB protein
VKNLQGAARGGAHDGRMKLTIHLVIAGAARAIDWYVKVLGARELARFVDKKLDRVVHADLEIGGLEVSIADENREWRNDAPASLGGTPVVLVLRVDDAHATGARMTEAGAKVVHPIQDHFYGERQGRVEDPFGHMWLITQRLKEMSPEEIQRGVDSYSS